MREGWWSDTGVMPGVKVEASHREAVCLQSVEPLTLQPVCLESQCLSVKLECRLSANMPFRLLFFSSSFAQS